MTTVCRLAASIALALLVAPAIAGGEAWKVRVLSLEQGWLSRFTLQVQVLPQDTAPDATLLGCTRLTVRGRFAQPSLLRAHPLGVTRGSHDRALEVLRSAKSIGLPVRFGVLGTGLVPEPEGPACVFRSRGLHPSESLEGIAVLSLHNAVKPLAQADPLRQAL
jgi:hypothetical protein